MLVDGKTILDNVTLTNAFAGNTATVEAGAGSDVILFFDYTKGDETVGMEFKVQHHAPDGTLHDLGEQTGTIWTALADQKINATAKIAVPFKRVTGALEVAVRFQVTSAAPGTVTVQVAVSDERG